MVVAEMGSFLVTMQQKKIVEYLSKTLTYLSWMSSIFIRPSNSRQEKFEKYQLSILVALFAQNAPVTGFYFELESVHSWLWPKSANFHHSEIFFSAIAFLVEKLGSIRWKRNVWWQNLSRMKNVLIKPFCFWQTQQIIHDEKFRIFFK